MRRRHLHPEERALWEAVARTAKPALGRKPYQADPPEPAAPAVFVKAPPKPPLAAFALGQSAPATPAAMPQPRSPGEVLRDAPLRMDAGTHTRMTRGKLAPEARIDLHGMTLAEAHTELTHFLLNAWSRGLRLVLVITGKGKSVHDHLPHSMRIGAIRQQAPHWMRLAPLASIVQQVAEAHLRHGGSGAYYVYLRRK